MGQYAHLSDLELAGIGRMRCCIPGCRRTAKVDPDVVGTICGQHWRLADRRIRRLMSRVERSGKREGWSQRLLDMHHRVWERGRIQATERAMGL